MSSSTELVGTEKRTALPLPKEKRTSAYAVLVALLKAARQSGDPDKPFYYLGGPMTGIPQFNFPAFLDAGEKLRASGLNIISPAEIDTPETFKAAMESPDGAPGSGSANGENYEDFLGRDLILCSLPTCVGAIFLDGWHNSRGAGGESWVTAFLKKPLFLYHPNDTIPRGFLLEEIKRDATIENLGGDLDYMGRLPVLGAKPGSRTVEANSDENGAPIQDAEVVE